MPEGQLRGGERSELLLLKWLAADTASTSRPQASASRRRGPSFAISSRCCRCFCAPSRSPLAAAARAAPSSELKRSGYAFNERSYAANASAGRSCCINRSPSCSSAGSVGPGVTACFGVAASSAAASVSSARARSGSPCACARQPCTARRSTPMLRANRSSPLVFAASSSFARRAMATCTSTSCVPLAGCNRAAPTPRANQVTASGHGYLSHAIVSGVRVGSCAADAQSPRSSA
jgi:hypothetical protein